MTPRQLQALRARQIVRMQREELLLAMLHCSLINFSFCRPDQAVKPESFMLHPLANHEEGVEEPAGMTGEQVMAAFAPWRQSGLVRRIS